jgi:hypothetical protein
MKSAGRRRWWWIVAAAASILLLAAAAVLLLPLATFERHTGFFGPAFSRDGRSVFFVERSTTGISWGVGWEFFTPPASVRALSDTVRLRRLDLDSGGVTTLETWQGSPVVGRTLAQYRGRLFVYPKASLRPQADGSLQYTLELALPRVPSAEVHQLRGVWRPAGGSQRGDWAAGQTVVAGASDPVIDGQRELFVLPGPESFPAALVLLDHADGSMRILRQSPAYGSRYPAGPQLAALMEVSRKPSHDRVQEMIRIEQERVAEYRRQGASEAEALLRAERDLRDLGFYPKPQRWVATLLDPPAAAERARLPRIDIADEIKVGLFPDLEQAMRAPGTEVDKSMSRYLRHRDYDSSERLNALLDSGAKELLVGYGGRVYLFRLLPAEPAAGSAGRAGN